MRRQITGPAVLLLAGAGAFACSEPNTPFAVVVNPATVTLDAVGATRQLSVTVTNEKGKELLDATVEWSSSAGTVASVSDAGLVTAAGSGTADITATAGPASGKAAITVNQTVSTAEATSGAQQTGVVNAQLPQALTIRARDRLGAAVPGLTVTFAVSTDGGTVSPTSATSDAQGQASTTWTLGTKAGLHTVTAALSMGGQTVTFNGKANPGPAAVFSKAGGDAQYGFQGSRLDTLVGARVRDQFGNGVPSHPVSFAVATGNGSVDSAIAFTDATGVARTGWVMPAAIDTVDLQAAANTSGGGPLLNSPLSYSAISHNLRVQSVTPAPLVEGQTATLDGSGFDPNPSGNVVTVDGVAATVTAASASQLTITVPTSDCKPARATTLRVTVGTIPASPRNVNLNPASTVTLSPGQQTIQTSPAGFCLQFPATTSADSYLVAVQSVSEDHTVLTGITLSATVAPSASVAAWTAAPTAARARQQRSAQAPKDPAALRWLVRHRAAELQQREFDRVNFERIRTAPLPAPEARKPPPVDVNVIVGDTIDLKVNSGPGTCSSFASIAAVVRAKVPNAFFLEDAANPTAGFTTDDWTRFSSDFDTKYHPALVNEFGAVGTDTDGNGRMVVVVTREVNRRGSLGFTTSCDLSPLDASHASNGGEFFYVAAPDPTGTINNDTLTLALARELMPSVLAHEPVHVIQFNRRRAAGGSMVSVWLAEGQATLGEEIVGHAVEGRTPNATNPIDLTLVLNQDDETSVDWYSSHIVALSLYFGWDPVTQSPQTGRVANAPHECTWLSTKPGNQGPCVGGLDPYGAPWSLLRYISDRFGPTFTGGEPGIQKTILDQTVNGYALLETITGERIDTLLARWAAMLYVDGRPGVGENNPAVLLPSWDLYDIYYGTSGGFILLPVLRLVPATASFADFSRTANVRAGSAYYTVIGGGNAPATAVKARDSVGQILPAHMRFWVVRLK